jgi:hypothetical protein
VPGRTAADDPDLSRFEDMTGTQHDDQQSREPTRINPIAIIAGALASLSAAVIASYFGVAGTLIGAAVVSVVSSLAAAIYAGLLGRGQGLAQRAAVTVLHSTTDRTGANPTEDRPTGEPAGGAESGEGGGPDGAAGAGAEAAASRGAGAAGPRVTAGSADDGRGPRSPVRWSWRRSVVVVGVAAVLIFGIAIGAVSAIEAAIREPIASALGVRDKGQARTSVGVAVHRAGGSETTPTSSPTPSTQTPPSSGQQPEETSPPTTEPAPPTSGGSQPPSTTVPPTTSQKSAPSSSSGATSGR